MRSRRREISFFGTGNEKERLVKADSSSRNNSREWVVRNIRLPVRRCARASI